MRLISRYFFFLSLLLLSACYLETEVQCLSDQDCVGGQTCQEKLCVCLEGRKFCNNLCVDTNSDANHCGACGQVCPKGQSCRDGSCQEGKVVCSWQSCESTDECSICEGDHRCVLIGGAAGFCRPTRNGSTCPSTCSTNADCLPCGAGSTCLPVPSLGGVCQ